MSIIKQIDPASGPSAHYPDMATWEAALGGGDQEAVVWNTGDVGGLTLNDADPDTVLIRPRAGHQHNGTLASALTAARAASAWSIQRSGTVRGIAISVSSGIAFTALGNSAAGIVIDAANMLIHSTPSTATSLRALGTNTGHAEIVATMRNSVIYSDNSGGLAVSCTADSISNGNSTLTAIIENCTLRNLAAAGTSIGVRNRAVTGTGSGVLTSTVTARNVAAMGFATDFAEQELAGSGGATVSAIWSDCTHNASSDGTADDFGGSGHLVNQAAGDWFADVDADLRKRFGSPGIRAGATIATVPTDFRGRRREGRHDIGFDQFPTLGDARTRRLLGCRE